MSDLEGVVAHILGKLREMKGYYTAIAAYDVQNGFSDCITRDSRDFFLRAVAERGCDRADPHVSRIVEFNCAGLNHLVIEWIRDGMEDRPDALAADLMRFVSPELKDMVEKGNAR